MARRTRIKVAVGALALGLAACGGGEGSSDEGQYAAIKACNEALAGGGSLMGEYRNVEATPIDGGKGYRVDVTRKAQMGATCPALIKGSCIVTDGNAQIEHSLAQDGYEVC